MEEASLDTLEDVLKDIDFNCRLGQLTASWPIRAGAELRSVVTRIFGPADARRPI